MTICEDYNGEHLISCDSYMSQKNDFSLNEIIKEF